MSVLLASKKMIHRLLINTSILSRVPIMTKLFNLVDKKIADDRVSY